MIDKAESLIELISQESFPHTRCTDNPHMPKADGLLQIDLTPKASTSDSIPDKEFLSPLIHPDIEQPCESSSPPANHPSATKRRFGDIKIWPAP